MNLAKGPATFVMPLRGVSAIDAPGEPFYSPAADAAFLEALKRSLSPSVKLVEVDAHINDESFVQEVVALLVESMNRCSQS
jgi:uncharacterized protein (UPF0261 family)